MHLFLFLIGILFTSADIFIPNLVPEFIKYNPNYEQSFGNIIQQLEILRPSIIEALNGTNITCIVQVLDEIKILLGVSAHTDIIEDRVQYLQYLIELPPFLRPQEHQDPIDGSFGTCFTLWYQKLEVSTDIFLQSNYTPEYYPHFLDQINDPQSLQNYLDSLVVSDIALTGTNNVIELNEGVANLYRLVTRGKPNGYKWNPGVEEVILHFIYESWRNPETGYWGPWYLINDTIYKVPDLSSTFHIISYLKGNVPDWPIIINTTLALKPLPFDWGWFGPNNTYWNHNNMDIVTIFSYGWNEIPEYQHQILRENIWEMLNYTLKYSLLPNGEFKMLFIDDSAETAEYFGCAFLGRIGFFNEERRFWTNDTFPEAASIKESIENYIQEMLKQLGYSDPTDTAYLLSALSEIQ